MEIVGLQAYNRVNNLAVHFINILLKKGYSIIAVLIETVNLVLAASLALS